MGKFEISNLKNDFVIAKNAEITNLVIMSIFNRVTSNKQWIDQGTTQLHLQTIFLKNQMVPSFNC